MVIIAGIIAAVGAVIAAAAPIVKALAIAGLAVEGIKKIGGVLITIA